MTEPIAERRAHTWKRPTGDVDDPWAWLADRDDPATTAYLEAENAHTAEWFAPREPLVDEIFTEIKSRIQETDMSVPTPDSGWFYVTRTIEGAAYPLFSRGRTAETADRTLLLDANAEAAGHDYFALHAFDPSPDHTRVAWSADTNGDEKYLLRIRNLPDHDGDQTASTSGDHDDHDAIADTAPAGVAWSADGAWLFYVRADEQMRPFEIWRHRVGDTDGSDDQLVLREDDQRFHLSVGTTRSRDWIVITADSQRSSQVHLLDAHQPLAEPALVRPRVDGHEYFVDHWGDCFVILTNDEAPDFRVMTAPLDAPDTWTELVAHVPSRRIVGVEPFADHLAVHDWSQAQQRLWILSRDGSVRRLHASDEPHEIEFGPNVEWDTPALRFQTQSLNAPPSLWEEDVRTGRRVLLKSTPTPNVDLNLYTSARTWATAPDGTKVPVDVVRHVDTPVDGTAPCVLYGYGAYEASFPVWFSVARLSLLDRGFVWALAHPRGGGELGRTWYEDGKLLSKRNTFDDMIAAARHLVDERWSAPDRLCVRGGSAGGLLVGACITQEPSLFTSAVAEVPFVDVVTTMSDPSLPLTVTEWEEWGDPREQPYADYIASYSPYDRTGPADYPALYITAGLNDVRVSYHEPAKWTAKLRTVRTNPERPLLLHCEMDAGHAGPSGRYDMWRDEAKTLAFIVETT